ncbi:MAG: hypothetical protein ABF535_12555 [Acetobacter sp.]
MRLSFAILSVVLTCLPGQVTYAASAPPVAEIARNIAQSVQSSGKLPLRIEPGMMLVSVESAGVYLIYNIEISKGGAEEYAKNPQIAQAMQKIFTVHACSSRNEVLFANDGLVVRANYRVEGSPAVLVSFDISKKDCSTHNSTGHVDAATLHDYLARSVTAEQKRGSDFGAIGTIANVQVVGNNVVYTVALKDDTLLDVVNARSGQFIAVECGQLKDSTPLKLGAGFVWHFYNRSKTQDRTMTVNSAVCNALH